MRLYVDTNVYLDFFFKRKNSQHAFRIFRHALQCRYEIVISDHLLVEIGREVYNEDIKMLFLMLKKKIIKISTTDEDIIQARDMTTHFADALHIVLAKKAEADCIVTNNVKDFYLLFQTKRPEDF